MKNRPPYVMTTLGLAVLFGLLYRLHKQGATSEEIKSIFTAVEKNLRETESMHRDLRRTRGAVNEIHQHLVAVPKGVKKTAS